MEANATTTRLAHEGSISDPVIGGMRTVRTGSRKLLSGCGAALAALTVAGAAIAQQRTFDIPAQEAVRAIPEFARQAGIQIIAPSSQLRGVRTPALRGDLDARQALRVLLRGTGLEVATDNGTVITLRRASSAEANEGAGMAEIVSTELDDVVVTGTLLRSSGALASPVIILDQDALARSGYGTVAEAVVALPQNYAGTSTPVVQLANANPGASNQTFATGVNLRGLGPASTLVLVNGRRMAGTGSRAEFADISALPSAAVERVDVLLDGASALYGADAVAGVVNVIMRRSFDGHETRLRASAAKGGAEDVTLSHLMGTSWSTGSAYLSYEYQEANGLSSLDRAYTADGDLRRFGGTDHRSVYSTPGNIVAFNPAAGAYVTTFGIQPGGSGRAETAADFSPGLGNLQSSSLGTALLPNFERQSVYGSISQSLGDRLDLNADVRFTRRDYAIDVGPAAGIFTVTQANPWFVSPTGAASHTIAYAFGRELGQTRNAGRSDSHAVTLSARYALTDDWSIEAYVADARENARFGTFNRPHSRRLAEALGNIPDDPDTPYRAAVDGYFNLFGDGTANSRAVLDFIGGGYSRSFNESQANSANVVAQGPALRLPGGDVQVALGAQWRRETFETGSLNAASTTLPQTIETPERERSIAAVFAEARIPIVGPENTRPGIRSLDLSIAGRFEEYDDFGSTTNPKVGVVWSPFEGLGIRTSWGTSFRAGALPQLFDAQTAATTFFDRTNGTRVLSLNLGGGNADLRPETADTFTLGFDYRPNGRPAVSVNYFDTRYEDKIARPTTENISGVLDDPNLAPFVRFVSPGTNAADLALVQSYSTYLGFSPLYPATTYGAIVDSRWVNAGSQRVRGLDLAVTHGLDVAEGRLNFDVSGSYILEYRTQATPTAARREVAGLIGFPVKLRARSAVTWSRGGFDIGASWSYVDDYEDRLGVGIDAFHTVDAQIGWSPASQTFSGTRVTLTVRNLLDQDPPFYDSAMGYGFDAAQGDLLGRVFALQLTQRW